MKAFKEAQHETFSKDLGVVWAACQNYCKAHKAIFEWEGSYDLTSVFWQMARDTNFLNPEIHKVQEVWTGQQGLKATNHAAKAQPPRGTYSSYIW